MTWRDIFQLFGLIGVAVVMLGVTLGVGCWLQRRRKNGRNNDGRK